MAAAAARPDRAHILELLELATAITVAGGRATDGIDWARDRLQLPRELLDPPPLVTGDDLVAHGVPRGPQFKRLLEAVRDAQLDGTIHNREEAFDLVNKLRSDQGPNAGG